MKYYKWLSLLFLILVLAGCAKKPYLIRLPPVTEGWHKASSIKSAYVVQPKDTLYSIAWAFGSDYRHLAAINGLHSPYMLRVGQRLRLKPSAKERKFLARTLPQQKLYAVPKTKWLWPTRGEVVNKFRGKLGSNQGINIAGVVGQPIIACNFGTVVYSGTGIRSYGKLLIIKHSDDYLSAYAYNQKILVTEGQVIKKGQEIATMGRNDSGITMLHFEIRRFGKPLDPLFYLTYKHA